MRPGCGEPALGRLAPAKSGGATPIDAPPSNPPEGDGATAVGAVASTSGWFEPGCPACKTPLEPIVEPGKDSLIARKPCPLQPAFEQSTGGDRGAS
ncbi:MAG: hypothetical protein F6K28_24055 [Microcoleus sp. SIO2G3]|nr:hypothetical protein [Microcoleus sp. SIO2G3]